MIHFRSPLTPSVFILDGMFPHNLEIFKRLSEVSMRCRVHSLTRPFRKPRLKSMLNPRLFPFHSLLPSNQNWL